ncbi:MAG: hypothetical protein LBU40_03925 [Methanobrevibacter sp.]|jgi:hypothetical protein|nr:hypothetical protein [Methanobrevibacter sp.]
MTPFINNEKNNITQLTNQTQKDINSILLRITEKKEVMKNNVIEIEEIEKGRLQKYMTDLIYFASFI